MSQTIKQSRQSVNTWLFHRISGYACFVNSHDVIVEETQFPKPQISMRSRPTLIFHLHLQNARKKHVKCSTKSQYYHLRFKYFLPTKTFNQITILHHLVMQCVVQTKTSGGMHS